MLRTPLLALAAVVLPLHSTAASAQRAAPETWSFGGVAFPAQVDTFSVLAAQVMPDTDPGTVLSYSTPVADGNFTVLVQPVPADAPDDALREAFDADVGALREQAAEAPEGTAIEVDTTRSVTIDANGRPFEGWAADATIRQGSMTLSLRQYVFRKDDSYLKLRILYERSMRTLLSPHVEGFVAGVLAGVEPGG